jgi:nitrate reductase gamma subunit
MYYFLTGPFLWLSFGVFFIGLVVRTVIYIKGLDWKLDRVTYHVNVSYGVKGALRSIFFWLLPFGTRRWRTRPGMALLFFIFHFGLIVTPIFLLGHAIMLKQRWGIGWFTIPGIVADVLTVAVIVTGLFLCLRRIALAEVRILTTAYDYILLAIAVAPFVTGFFAAHQAQGYSFWLMAHIISAEIMLIAIPLTKLSHVALFFLSRAQIGMDFGIKRGGMKSNGLPW